MRPTSAAQNGRHPWLPHAPHEVAPCEELMGAPVMTHEGAAEPHPAHCSAHSGVALEPHALHVRVGSAACTWRSMDCASTQSLASSTWGEGGGG